MFSFLLLAASVVAADPLPDGSLLFLENCNKFVELYTENQTGHVALVFNVDNVTWVYEATPAQVRRMTLDDYNADLARLNFNRNTKIALFAYRPQVPYEETEVEAMRKFLDDQLGRRYSLKNYLTGEVGDGTHCAELTGNTLNHTTRFDLTETNRNTPAQLRDKICSQYQSPLAVTLPSFQPTETWCQRADRRWHEWSVWCGWSYREVTSFCW